MPNLLEIGQTGLRSSKKALETTGHNISNANTEGYSRQRVDIQTATPIAQGGLIHGRGSQVRDIERIHDVYTQKRLNKAQSDVQYYKTRSDSLSQIENMFNEVDSKSLNQAVTRFFNAFRDLANQPENETVRAVVRDNAQIVIKDINNIRASLDSLSRYVDKRIEGAVEDVNGILSSLAAANNKIAELEVAGGETGDLRDQRDFLVQKLASYVKVSYYEDKKGRFVVNAKDLGSVVVGGKFEPFKAVPVSQDQSESGLDGSVEIFFKNRSVKPITKKFRGGEIEAFLKVRNKDVQNFQKNIDTLAFHLAKSVNAIHRKGYVGRAIPTGIDGKPAPIDSVGPTTGVNFFEEINDIDGAAHRLELSQALKEDPSNIITGLGPNAPGDNRIALAISKLQHERQMDNGHSTMEEYFLKTVGNVGIEAGKSRMQLEQSEGILAQVKNMRERISGVSIDEEAANLVRHQHVYEASAKVMKSAEEMFNTLLGIKR